MTNDLRSRLLNEDHNYHEAACHEAWAKIEALTAERDARIEALTAQLTTARADYQIESDLREVEEALLKAAEAERDARIDPAEVQALVNAAEPMLATALAAAEAERDRLRAVLEAIVDEYNGQVHGPIIYSIADAHAALKGETP